MPTKHNRWLSQAAVVGVFFAVIAIGLIYAVFNMKVVSAPRTSLPAALRLPPPLTVSAYQAEAKSVFGPFMQQALRIGPADPAYADPVFSSLIQKTEDSLLRMERLPSSVRDAHLSFVMLLEKWKRAVGGSRADQEQLARATRAVADANPWLLQ